MSIVYYKLTHNTSERSVVMEKKMQDATEYSKKAMFTNPAASSNDCTGYSQRVDMDTEEAEQLADLMDVTVKQSDAKAK